MKLTVRIFLFLILGLALLIGLNWQKINRLMTVNSLFDADNIVENFSNMDAAFLHQDLERGDTPFVWPEDIQPLPEAVTVAGKEENLSDLLETLDTTALVVIKDGTLIHESYYRGTEKDDLRISLSLIHI